MLYCELQTQLWVGRKEMDKEGHIKILDRRSNGNLARLASISKGLQSIRKRKELEDNVKWKVDFCPMPSMTQLADDLDHRQNIQLLQQ